MFKSMTGHGEARGEGDGFELSLELWSVNHRFLRVTCKAPEEISFLVPELEAKIRRRIHRGTIFLNARFTPNRTADFYQIDPEVLRKYFRTLESLAQEFKTDEKVQLKDLLVLPGSVRAQEAFLPAKSTVLPVALELLSVALDQLETMRDREGAAAHQEFRQRWAFLTNLLERIRILAPEAIAGYRARLEDRVRKLLTNHEISLSPEDMLKEVAIVAERSDIAEELSRMQSHLEQFRECLDAGGVAGRKLEFLIQEMFRESNTMGSKSIHPEVNRILVDFKGELDRLREQAQNVE